MANVSVVMPVTSKACILLFDYILDCVVHYKYLALHICNNLCRDNHITQITNQALSKLQLHETFPSQFFKGNKAYIIQDF